MVIDDDGDPDLSPQARRMLSAFAARLTGAGSPAEGTEIPDGWLDALAGLSGMGAVALPELQPVATTDCIRCGCDFPDTGALTCQRCKDQIAAGPNNGPTWGRNHDTQPEPPEIDYQALAHRMMQERAEAGQQLDLADIYLRAFTSETGVCRITYDEQCDNPMLVEHFSAAVRNGLIEIERDMRTLDTRARITPMGMMQRKVMLRKAHEAEQKRAQGTTPSAGQHVAGQPKKSRRILDVD